MRRFKIYACDTKEERECDGLSYQETIQANNSKEAFEYACDEYEYCEYLDVIEIKI